MDLTRSSPAIVRRFAGIIRWPLVLAVSIVLGFLGVLPVSSVSAAGPTQPPFTAWWVENFVPTHLWSAQSDPAVDYGPIPQWSYLLVVAPQTGPRLSVYVPWTKNYAFVDSKSVGPSGPPTADWVAAMSGVLLPVSGNRPTWVGRVVGNGVAERQATKIRAARGKSLPPGAFVQVVAWVVGEEQTIGNWTWGQLADGSFVYSTEVQAVAPTRAPKISADHPSGKWVDVNLLQQTAVAYQDSTPVYLATVSTGSPGWETPLGTHLIQRRVADETMAGATLSHLGLDSWQAARVSYNIDHVLDTQYFDDLGDALHANYWLPSSQFGIPHSHGCVGMRLADAQWFWNWADYGVPVVVRAS